MKNSISKNIQAISTFTFSLIFAIILTATTLSYIEKNYGESSETTGLEKSDMEAIKSIQLNFLF